MDPFQRMSPAEAVAELRNLASGVDFALTLDELRPLFYRADTLAKQHPDHEEAQAILADIKRKIASRGNAIKQGTAQRPVAPSEAPLPPPPDPFSFGQTPTGNQPVAASPPPEPSFAWPSPPVAPASPASGGTIITPVSPDSIPTASFDVNAFQFPQSPGATPPPPPPVFPPNQPAARNPTAAPFPPPSAPGTRNPTAQGPGVRTQQMGTGGTMRTPTPQRAMAAPAGKKRSLLPLFLLGALIWLAAVGGGLFWYFKIRNPGIPGAFSVEFITNPPGADVRVDGELIGKSNRSLEMAAGEHKLEVVLDGYEPAVSTFAVGEGQPTQVSLNLTPRPQTVRFYTDLSDGTVTLDGQPAGQLQDGQLVLESVAPGSHTVQVAGGKSEVSFSFDLTPGKAPTLTSPITAKEVLAVIVSNAGKQAFARSSAVPMKVVLDGNAMGEITQDGLTMDDIYPGDHELTLGDGANARKIVVNFGPSPVLTAFLKLDLNAGTLVVVAGEDDATITINGRPYRGRTKRGMVRIPNLAVTDYVVKVSKEGFESPPEQVAKVQKGEEARLAFVLKPVPQFAALRVKGAAQGTTIVLDGNALGTVGGDGILSVGNIVPGEHTIELRRERHRPKRFQKTFAPGMTIEIADEVALEKLPGTLRLQLSPADSRVVLRAANQGRGGERVIQETTVTIPEGSYTLSATAPNFSERTATIQVAAGEVVNVDLRLGPITKSAKIAPPSKPIGMEGWEQPGLWTAEGSWQTRQGGNYVLFGSQPVNGSFTFTSAILRGGRLRWVVNFQDARNHVLMEVDTDDYWRKIVKDGRARELFKAKHGVDKRQGYWTLSIDLTANMLTHKVFREGQWSVLDTWTVNDQDFTAGKFGFYIPDRDRVGISNFTFIPRQ